VDREKEISAINKVFSKISPSNIIQLNNTCRIEGGDVILNNKDIFIGYSKKNDFENFKVARTNESAVNEIKNIFSNKNVFSFELKKSDLKPDENALHLDCCFQPIGQGFAIIYENGFKNKSDINLLIDIFGNNNLIRISKQEMYEMNSNVFSISENIIVSEMGFNRLNNILREKGFIVEEIKFSEIAKMEGLLRCATLPLYRK
jgi:N-dimethylarginine dimethylaminohydrolase